MSLPWFRSTSNKSRKTNSSQFKLANARRKSFRPVVELLEARRVLTHVGDGDFAILPPPLFDPNMTSVQSQPPGDYSGATPAGFPAYATLASGMPVLNSRSVAPTAIYLDFDGDTSGSNPYGDGTVSPYTEDADGTTFNTSEQRSIFEAWRQVSSYFSIFDVNVTTVPPPSAMPKAWLAVGNNISGGYSYVNVFPNTTPESWNNSGQARTRVSGIAHELGHNFGLQHQSTYDQWGVKTAEYASATDALHGPIMGLDFSGTVHKFFVGHNSTSSGVTTLQDDIAIIANKIKAYQPVGGDGFRADDFGNTIATAFALPLSDAAQWTSAIIERNSDIDAFSFVSAGGVYSVSAAPDAPSGVDLKLEIYAGNGSLVAASDGANNVQQLTMNLGAGTYYAMVSSHGNYGDLGRYFVSASALPTGWAAVDVGTGVSAYTVFDASTGKFSLVSTGTGVSGLADGLQYAYQPLTGDGSIVARVVNVDNTSASAVSGLMIRESAASNSREVSIGKTSGGTPKFFSRSTVGGSTSTVTGAGTHSWLKLDRSANTFTSFTSPDGISWTQLGTVEITMSSAVFVGLFTASANNHALNVGQLDSVSVTGDTSIVSPTYNELSQPDSPAVSLGSGSGLNVAWSSVAGANGYAVDRSADGINFEQIGTTTSTSYSDPNLVGSMRYFYRVSATDDSGRSIPSAIVSAVNRPSQATALSIVSPSATQLVLNWRETTGESGYRIARSTDGITYTTLATVGANIPSYTDSGLTSGVAYSYIVTPTSSLGDGVASTVASGAPRLAAVTPAIGTIAAGSITINWSDLANETGYRVERSIDGKTFSTLANIASNIASYTDSTVASAVEYYYRVFGTTALTQSLIGAVKFAAAASTSAPPAPWSSQDVGTLSGPGTTDLTGSTFKIVSSGTDVASSSDSFRFTSQSMSGDGEIVARVVEVENTGANAKAGVMIRQSTAANAANVHLYVTPTSVGLSYRATNNGATTTVTTVAGTSARWLKLNRAGNSFTASYSSDGTTWSALGTANVKMSSGTAIGLSGVANSSTALNTSTFDNVSVQTSRSLAITDGTVTEGDSGTTSAIFTVTLSQASTNVITVAYATQNGSALSTSDYNAVAGTLTFNPGELSKTISVSVVGDTLYEANENFFVNLSSATNAVIADSQGVGTIQNDDASSLPAASISDASIVEGSKGTKKISFTISLSAPATSNVSFSYSTANGTATSSSDFKAASGSVTIAAGASSATIGVTIVGDKTTEADETFFVNIFSPVNATLLDSQAMGTIINDDGVPLSGQTFETLAGEADHVIDIVRYSRLDVGSKDALLKLLTAAQESLERQNLRAASEQLAAALNYINLLKKRGLIVEALAEWIIEETEGISSSLIA